MVPTDTTAPASSCAVSSEVQDAVAEAAERSRRRRRERRGDLAEPAGLSDQRERRAALAVVRAEAAQAQDAAQRYPAQQQVKSREQPLLAATRKALRRQQRATPRSARTPQTRALPGAAAVLQFVLRSPASRTGPRNSRVGREHGLFGVSSWTARPRSKGDSPAAERTSVGLAVHQ